MRQFQISVCAAYAISSNQTCSSAMRAARSGGSTVPPFTCQRPRIASPVAALPSRPQAETTDRRSVLSASGALLAGFLSRQPQAQAATEKLLCDSECKGKLDSIKEVKTSTGLRYKDIVEGKGPTPPTGYQVVADYVAMTPDGRVFDSSLEKGRPYDLRIGSGQIVAGLDEGVKSMRTGGIRRIFVPGNLAFPKGLPSGPGRPRVPPSSPIMFDVHLLFIPGLDEEE